MHLKIIKKLVKISSIILLFLIATSTQFVNAQEEEKQFLQEKIMDLIFDKTNLSEEEITLEYSLEKSKGQNLYLASYNKQQVNPIDKVISKLSQNYTYYNTKTNQLQTLSQAEVRDFLLNRKVDPSLSDSSLVGVQHLLNEIEANFNNEL